MRRAALAAVGIVVAEEEEKKKKDEAAPSAAAAPAVNKTQPPTSSKAQQHDPEMTALEAAFGGEKEKEKEQELQQLQQQKLKAEDAAVAAEGDKGDVAMEDAAAVEAKEEHKAAPAPPLANGDGKAEEEAKAV